jgi:hypothetical protein
MAQTKANATYAVTTLNLLTNGPMKVIERAPWFTSLPAVTADRSKPLLPEKVSATVYPRHPHRAAAPLTWLKSRKINALKSL